MAHARGRPVVPTGANNMTLFDPKTVPVIGIDTDLPAVAPQVLTAEALRARFAAPPVWVPEVAREPRFTDRAPQYAAVLVPVVQRDEPTVLLTQRTAHLSTHSGQVAFPGGKVDDGDADDVPRPCVKRRRKSDITDCP